MRWKHKSEALGCDTFTSHHPFFLLHWIIRYEIVEDYVTWLRVALWSVIHLLARWCHYNFNLKREASSRSFSVSVDVFVLGNSSFSTSGQISSRLTCSFANYLVIGRHFCWFYSPKLRPKIRDTQQNMQKASLFFFLEKCTLIRGRKTACYSLLEVLRMSFIMSRQQFPMHKPAFFFSRSLVVFF